LCEYDGHAASFPLQRHQRGLLWATEAERHAAENTPGVNKVEDHLSRYPVKIGRASLESGQMLNKIVSYCDDGVWVSSVLSAWRHNIDSRD
jgi:hypothetical protein